MSKLIYADINAVAEKESSLESVLSNYCKNGIDGFYIYDYSVKGERLEAFLHTVRELMEVRNEAFVVGILAVRFEDIKKAVYTGAKTVYLRYSELNDAFYEGFRRFGADKVGVELNYRNGECDGAVFEKLKEIGVKKVLIKHIEITESFVARLSASGFEVVVRDSLRRNDLKDLLDIEPLTCVSTTFYAEKDVRRIKRSLKDEGVDTLVPAAKMSFSELKKNSDGLVPVIVCDYRNNEVLMLAYMNEQAYNSTIETGLMNYYSRSRQSQWLKGETSGHFQHVKELMIDCDNDTILAKVDQIGAACHTGNRSCFYTSLTDSFSDEKEIKTSLSVLKEVYDTIADRRIHPKEGSYTNYLFDKGIDKILKKCGEEATEIVIAAKNPDQIELKYEIADYLYHLMVLMVSADLSWDEVMEELANRH